MQAQLCELAQCWHYFHTDADGTEGSCAPDLCSGVSVFCLAHPTLEYAGHPPGDQHPVSRWDSEIRAGERLGQGCRAGR